LAETMSWTRAGWIELVTDFSLESRARPRTVPPTQDQPIEPSAECDVQPQTIDLQMPKTRREPNLPDLSLSDALRGRLTWLAMDTGQPVDQVLHILINLYCEQQKQIQPDTLASISKIIALARAQDRAEVDLDTLHRYLMAEETLAKHRRRFEDVPQALRLIESLAALPQSWTWRMVESAMQAVAFLIENDIRSSDVAQVLRRHQRLSELGFEETEAEAVADALVRAGAVGKQRTRVLNRLVAVAGKLVNAAELEQERLHLEHTVTVLRRQQAQLEANVQQMKNQLGTGQTEMESH
jgi:hypothetical protein